MQTPTLNTPKNQFPTAWLAVAIVMVVGLLAFFVFQMNLIDFSGGQTVSSQPNVMRLETTSMKFGTNEITLPAGQPLTIDLNNGDYVEHSFDVDELDIHVPVDLNSAAVVQIPELAPGRYEFYCGVPGHREAGMVGELVIVD